MKISELSSASGVPISTIKFYIRQGLLPRGEHTSAANQATYGSQHLERLSLITALKEVAGLGNETLAKVFDAIDQPSQSGADPIHAALEAIYPEPDVVDEELAATQEEVRTFLRSQPWTTEDERYFFVHQIAVPLIQLRRYLHPDFGAAELEKLAQHMWRLTAIEFAIAPDPPPKPGDDLTAPTKQAVLGMLLFEPILLALRRCANAARGQRAYLGLDLP